MSMFGPILVLWILFLSLVQMGMLWKYLRVLRSSVHPERSESEYPPVVVVLSLRGSDPFLRDCLLRILDSDYPKLTLRVIVDSAEDPSLPIVRDLLMDRSDGRVELFILPERRLHCSGKVSGLLHATASLPADCQIVAWIDGDALIHRSAIKELVDGLRDPAIGAVSGNRWYLPEKATLPGLTRMFWNAFAVPAMNMVGIPWGGCMAIRADDFRNPMFREWLGEAFIEDSAISSYVRSTGRRTALVASAMLLNRESISLRDYYRFATRQLFTVRIDNSRWMWLALHMLTLNGTLLLALIPMAMPWLPWWKEICVTYFLLLAITLTAIPIGHQSVRRTLTARGEFFPSITPLQWLLVPVALLMPNQLNLASTINTFFIRRITWRGITYRFGENPKCIIETIRPLEPPRDLTPRSVI